jgi:uncharacterized protein
MHICCQCATVQDTCCCQGRDILLTVGDLERMSRLVGHSAFFEYRPITNPAYLDQPDDPNWLMYTLRGDGTRRVLQRNPAGKACQFLLPNGCLFPIAARPLVCRLYPFHYNEQGILGVASECPEYFLPAGTTILEALDMAYQDAEEWRQQLYAELRQEFETTRQFTVLPPPQFFLSPQMLPQTQQIPA